MAKGGSKATQFKKGSRRAKIHGAKGGRKSKRGPAKSGN